MSLTHDLSGGGVITTPLTSVCPDFGPGIITTPAPPGRRFANLHDQYGHYYVANGDGSGIRVRRADGPTPRTDLGGFALDTHATSNSADINPALLARPDGTIALFFERSGTVYFATSGDRGATWEAPTVALVGILPAAATEANVKSELVIAVQGDNSLKGTIRHLGDTAASAAFTLVDDASAPLVTDGTGPALSAPPGGGFELAITINGEADLSHWTNGDFGRTWKRVS